MTRPTNRNTLRCSRQGAYPNHSEMPTRSYNGAQVAGSVLWVTTDRSVALCAYGVSTASPERATCVQRS